MNVTCPMCAHSPAADIPAEPKYARCPICDLLFLRPEYRMGPDAEKARYLTHQNHPDDQGYIGFVKPLFDAMVSRIEPGSSGLDFGCGKASALTPLFERAGYRMTLYDPYFFPETPAGPFDFIVASEVAEHLYHPVKEFLRLFDWMKPGSWLGIMTLLLTDEIDFTSWHYRRDPTHVAFYSRSAMARLAQKAGFEQLTIIGERIVLLRRPDHDKPVR